MTDVAFGLGMPELLMLGGFLAVAAAIAYLMFRQPKEPNPLEASVKPNGKYGAAIEFHGRAEQFGDQVFTPVAYSGFVTDVKRNFNGTLNIEVEDADEKVSFTIFGAAEGINLILSPSANTLAGKPKYFCNMDRTSHPFPWSTLTSSPQMDNFQKRMVMQAKVDAKREALEAAEYRENVNPPESALDQKKVDTRRLEALMGGKTV